MFDDARFYARLAEDSRAYGRPVCTDSTMYIALSALSFDDDLLTAMERGDEYLI